LGLFFAVADAAGVEGFDPAAVLGAAAQEAAAEAADEHPAARGVRVGGGFWVLGGGRHFVCAPHLAHFHPLLKPR
jgi:hypothetical protein